MWLLLKPYLDILNHFGYRAQMKKLSEECYEFLEAVDNYEDLLLFGVGNHHEEKLAREFVIEEMADMLILLTQFIGKYEITQDELNAYMDAKLERTLARLDVGYYDNEEEKNSHKK